MDGWLDGFPWLAMASSGCGYAPLFRFLCGLGLVERGIEKKWEVWAGRRMGHVEAVEAMLPEVVTWRRRGCGMQG